MTKFQVGDCVQLKSGGSLMTVKSVTAPGHLDYFKKNVTCTYFFDNSCHGNTVDLPEEALELVLQNKDKDKIWELGDVVQLRSGGPLMTVVESSVGVLTTDCYWQGASSCFYGTYPRASLVKVNEDKPKLRLKHGKTT